MLASQTIAIRQSEIRQRLNVISGMEADQVTDEIRSEQTKLRKELDAKESEFRTAVEAEDTETRHRRDDDDGEVAEFRSLCSRVKLSRYLAAVSAGKDLSGETAEGELRSELKIGPEFIPYAALDPGERREARAPGDGQMEKREDVATQAPANIAAAQDMILGRVFSDTATAFLGVRMVDVPMGNSIHPVIESGPDAAIKGKGEIHEAAAATITSKSLDRRRATARYTFRIEDLGGMGDALEASLRQDAVEQIGKAVDIGVLRGDGTSPNPSGFLDPTNGPLAIPSADPTGVFDFAGFIGDVAGSVDGIYATNLMQVRALVNSDVYGLAAGKFAQAGEISAADYLVARSGGLRASGNMPDTASKIALNLAYRTGAAGASAVMPTWRGLEVYRDSSTRIGRGEIVVTAVVLFNFAVLRSAAYSVFKSKVAA